MPDPEMLPPQESDNGLVCAYVLDGAGGARPLGWAGVRSWQPEDGFLWVVIDRTGEDGARWLLDDSGVNRIAAEAMLESGSRPRLESLDGHLLVNLRGVNLNPGATPEDMVSLRVWVERTRVVAVRRERLLAVQDVRDALESARGPRDISELFALLVKRVIDRMNPVLAGLEDEVDQLEETFADVDASDTRRELFQIRRRAISLRRYIAPQREVMSTLYLEPGEWADADTRLRLREMHNRVVRYVEDLDSVRERASLMQDELSQRLSEQTNRIMYVLSLVAAVFLPLGFITGLLGINVGGMPGASASSGFAVVLVLLLAGAAIEMLVFRRMRWF